MSERSEVDPLSSIPVVEVEKVEKVPYYIKSYWIHREAIIAKKKVPYLCGCGGRYNYSGKVSHSYTQKHQKWLAYSLLNYPEQNILPHS